MAHEQHDAVVIGAGYAGLAAALTLADAGRSVVVLEARDRVGGRVRTDQVDGVPLDLGGMWLGAGHDRFAAWADRFGAQTFPTPQHGHDGLVRDGVLERITSLPGGWATLTALPALAQLEALARRLDVARPWGAPRAAELDRITADEWLRRWIPHRRTRALLAAVFTSSFAADPVEYSLLALVTGIADGGGLREMLGAEGGAQQDLFVSGADSPARAAAEVLGDRVWLGTPVWRIERSTDGVVAQGHSGEPVRVVARRAIIAIPPAQVLGLQIVPGLGARRRNYWQRSPMGSAYKAAAVYPRPFWRDAGWSGAVMDPDGPISSAFDATPPDGPGVLMTLVCGGAARRLAERPGPARRQLVLGAFGAWFGSSAVDPIAFREVCWDDEPWSGGGYSAVPTPGTISTLAGGTAAPDGVLHWAGTETADKSRGYIDGAIRSGERAATEVLAALAVPNPGAA